MNYYFEIIDKEREVWSWWLLDVNTHCSTCFGVLVSQSDTDVLKIFLELIRLEYFQKFPL